MNDSTHRGHAAVLVVTVLCGAMALPVSSAEQGRGHEDLLRTHRTMFEAMIVRHDASLFDEVALDGLLLVPPGGILESKKEALAGVQAFAVERVVIDEEVVTQQGDTAVVVAKLILEGEVRPVGRLGPMRTMSVFIKVEDEWRLLARSLTPCLPVAIKAGRC